MSERTSVDQHHQQEFVGVRSNLEHHYKDHCVSFESENSLQVHFRYHNENLLTQWACQAQQEESNNNNSKAGNHNGSNHMILNGDSVTAPVDSSEPTSRTPSEGAASSSGQQPTPTSQGFSDLPPPMFTEDNYYMQNNPNYVMSHNYSPNTENIQNGAGNFSRYHPYHHQQHFKQGDPATSVSSSNPQSALQCDKCGGVFEDPNQLADHVRCSHPTSPNSYPGQSQYQQIGTSPQNQMQRHHQTQMHTSPPQTNQQQPGFDFSGGSLIKTEPKHEAEEQAEILDLDSHKVQTHRYEQDMLRAQQQQQQQEIQMHMQQHSMQHMQRTAPHSVSSMLSWHTPQIHGYHAQISSIGPMESTPTMPDQNQFMQGQQISLEPSRHGSSPIITSTQSLATHLLSPVLLQQSLKPPLANQSWKSNEARRPKTYNCTACNKWFTSSGHLKRHYNTTLHKNAVKASNLPDPANMPISVHHYPGKEAVSNRGGPSSPELSSSGSPPNLMAGPSGEATRGLLLPPTTTSIISSSNSSNSSESSGIQGTLSQQQVASSVHMSNLVPLNCPSQSPMRHHPHQTGAPSPQLGQHTLQMNSQMEVHHPMISSLSSIQHLPTHLNSSSPMGQHHHMTSTSPIMAGVPPIISPQPPVGNISMQQQQYPNDLPPHVTTTTSIQGLMDITSLTTTGNGLSSSMEFTHEMLPVFGTLNGNQGPLPSFTNFGMTPGYDLVGHNQSLAVNVGGLSPEENIPPADRSFNTPMSTHDTYSCSPPKYESLMDRDVPHGATQDSNTYLGYHSYLQQDSSILYETNNNNLPKELPKEEVIPKKRRKTAKSKKVTTKEQQMTTTNSELPPVEKGRLSCEHCKKFFHGTCYLTQHNKRFHSGDRPFKCIQCGKRFSIEEDHDIHLNKHSGEKPYKCGSCPKQFNHKTDLRRHMCLHTGEKPYVCDICKKGFIRKDHMMKHVETHRKKQSNGQRNVHFRAGFEKLS